MDSFTFWTVKWISCKRFVDLLTFLLASPEGPSFHLSCEISQHSLNWLVYWHVLAIHSLSIVLCLWHFHGFIWLDRWRVTGNRERRGGGGWGWYAAKGHRVKLSPRPWGHWVSVYVVHALPIELLKRPSFRPFNVLASWNFLPSVSKLLVDMLPRNMKQTSMFYQSLEISQHPLNGLAQKLTHVRCLKDIFYIYIYIYGLEAVITLAILWLFIERIFNVSNTLDYRHSPDFASLCV